MFQQRHGVIFSSLGGSMVVVTRRATNGGKVGLLFVLIGSGGEMTLTVGFFNDKWRWVYEGAHKFRIGV